MVFGSAVLAVAIACTLVPSLKIIAPSLAFICGGFFSIHSSALGTLNRRLTGSRGRANSLYVLFYYLGGAAGISSTGWAYSRAGWHGVVALAIAVLTIPLGVGMYELAQQKISEAARQSPLVAEAKTNTRGMMDGMLHSLGFTQVTVIFVTPAPAG